MTYEHERGIIGMLGGIEDRHLIDLSDYKKELKEVYAKAKAWQELKEDIRAMFVYGSDLPKGTPSKYMNEAYGIVFERICELDGTHEFSNLLDDMNREDK